MLKLCVLHRTSHDEATVVYFSGFFPLLKSVMNQDNGGTR